MALWEEVDSDVQAREGGDGSERVFGPWDVFGRSWARRRKERKRRERAAACFPFFPSFAFSFSRELKERKREDQQNKNRV